MEETKVIHQIVKVQYYTDDERLSDRSYTYYADAPLAVGDIVTVPVRDTTAKAKVCAVDVPEAEIAAFKDKVKTIPAPTLKTAKEIIENMPIIDDPVITEALRDREIESGEVEANTGMALIKVQPESDITILSLLAQANQLRDYAIARVIATDEDMSLAVNDLSVIANVKKALTVKKAEYWKPIKSHLDAITASFQTLLTPIEDADRITRDKWTAYRNEQVRRKVEAEAINRAKEELARREAELNHGEITVDLTPIEAPTPIARVQTDMGTAGMRANWTYEITDLSLLPREYMIPDSAMLTAIARKHHDQKQVPGVKFLNKPILAVNTTRERDFSHLRTPSPGMP